MRTNDCCAICKKCVEEVGSVSVFSSDDDLLFESPLHVPSLTTYIKGKNICSNCMDKYNKIKALFGDYDFSSGGVDYYTDGRNL